jgi:hypothetical protein
MKDTVISFSTDQAFSLPEYEKIALRVNTLRLVA